MIIVTSINASAINHIPISSAAVCFLHICVYFVPMHCMCSRPTFTTAAGTSLFKHGTVHVIPTTQ